MILLHVGLLLMSMELTAAISHEDAWDAFMEKYPMDFGSMNEIELDHNAKMHRTASIRSFPPSFFHSRIYEQQLVSCDTSNGGCNGGNAFNAFRYVAKSGLLSQTVYPYTSSGGSRNGCNYNSKNVVARVSSRNPYTSIAYNTQRMMQVLANKGVVLVALCVTRPFMSYKSGVFTDNSCGKCPRNHAVVAVGYGTLNNIPYWIIRNSWSEKWGDNGYVLVKRGVDLCQIESDAMYTTVN